MGQSCRVPLLGLPWAHGETPAPLATPQVPMAPGLVMTHGDMGTGRAITVPGFPTPGLQQVLNIRNTYVLKAVL